METKSPPQDGADLETDSGSIVLPAAPVDNMTFTVVLPVQVREVPEDEFAIAIDNVAVSPDSVDAASTTTTTITVNQLRVPLLPEPPELGLFALTQPAPVPTAEGVIETGRTTRKTAPEGALQRLLYEGSLHLVNVGDSYGARQRKSLDARIGKHLEGDARFIPVLTRKGGVGKATITTILGMAMAEVRDDRVIAIDANPDRGTLAERVTKTTRATVRDVVTRAGLIRAFSDFQNLVSRDETRLDVLASDADPTVSEAFDQADYDVVADMAARYYSIVLTDSGTGIVHSVMRATLERADSIVVVSGGSVDEARLASETLTWLESNGYAELVSNAVVALNTATQGTNLVKLEEIEAHFRSRVREIVTIPYDPALATGSTIRFAELKPMTRDAARELAALVIDGLPEYRS